MDVNAVNIVISKLVKKEFDSNYFIGYLDKTIRLLVLIIPKINGCVKTSKVKGGNGKLIFFRTDDQKLLEKSKPIKRVNLEI